VLEAFSKDYVTEYEMGAVAARLSRSADIFKFIIGQIDILETMTPLDFMDFRDFLYPASGFQSYQFRMIETKLGLKSEQRLNFNQQPFYLQLEKSQQVEMMKTLEAPSLFDHLESWLKRMPFTQSEHFSFWQEYQNAVSQMFKEDLKVVENNSRLSAQEKERTVNQMNGAQQIFDSLFDPVKFQKLNEDQYFRLSGEAVKSALFILLYRHEPALQISFQVIQTLQDIDESLTQWRYRHALMAHRMLGKKIGTGGSSGHDYLASTIDKHKIFKDFFNLATFLIPKSKRPILPPKLRKQLQFGFENPE
ncbi:MAG: tryptophan 2,3-dioxygenase family protein, partial [Pseudobdellovibrionaceae bacterium]